jgi:protein-S-isoprenylcysteine O-methyltransferase Ste14
MKLRRGAAIGVVLYIGSRRYSPLEEKALATEFGAAWDEYCKKVLLPWL